MAKVSWPSSVMSLSANAPKYKSSKVVSLSALLNVFSTLSSVFTPSSLHLGVAMQLMLMRRDFSLIIHH
jgi:hypothetical protein